LKNQGNIIVLHFNRICEYFCGVRVAQSLVFCVVFCRSLSIAVRILSTVTALTTRIPVRHLTHQPVFMMYINQYNIINSRIMLYYFWHQNIYGNLFTSFENYLLVHCLQRLVQGNIIVLHFNRICEYFCGVRVAQSLVFCVVFCRSLFVLLSFVFSLLQHCLSFFNLRLLIIHLLSSNIYFSTWQRTNLCKQMCSKIAGQDLFTHVRTRIMLIIVAMTVTYEEGLNLFNNTKGNVYPTFTSG
jgi:hypothetical protein